jgi:UDP-N-acetylglucosamine 4,6-dehydratase
MFILKNKIILITGGTGSFGNALTDRLLPLKPKQVVIFSRDEKKQEDMRNKYHSNLLQFIIGDVRDRETVDGAMIGVDYVFHAAALKQVPTCEIFPLEAVKTNILGATNVIESAIKHKVKRVVILSTDKAVYPINAMGMTKALMEKIMIAYSDNPDTILCGVRYGNVLYSRGSVVPHFISSIKKGEPLKVTNPKMTRFLLTLNNAVDLVLETMAKGKRGQMYVRKSPACTMATLAEAVCAIFNYKKGWVEVGTRVGEKIHETLIPSEEEPFTSENTERLGVIYTAQLLLSISEIREELSKWHTE